MQHADAQPQIPLREPTALLHTHSWF